MAEPLADQIIRQSKQAADFYHRLVLAKPPHSKMYGIESVHLWSISTLSFLAGCWN
jgi:hypothetical protein